jgi:hypothetical protein
VIGLMPTDAEVTVIRADRLLGMLQCARLFHRIEHGEDIAAYASWRYSWLSCQRF